MIFLGAANAMRSHCNDRDWYEESSPMDGVAPMMAEPLAPFGGMGSCLGDFGHG